MLNPRRYQNKPLNSPRVIVWCSFTASSILSLYFFEEFCLESSWETCTVTTERHLMLLHDHTVLPLQERYALPVVTFMQDGSPPHIALEIKVLLLDTFTEDRVVSRGCKLSGLCDLRT